MRNRVLVILGTALLFVAGYLVGNRSATVACAETPSRGTVPKSYGRLVTAIADQIGTGLVFEGSDGVIRFVSITGMKEGSWRAMTKPRRKEESPSRMVAWSPQS